MAKFTKGDRIRCNASSQQLHAIATLGNPMHAPVLQHRVEHAPTNRLEPAMQARLRIYPAAALWFRTPKRGRPRTTCSKFAHGQWRWLAMTLTSTWWPLGGRRQAIQELDSPHERVLLASERVVHRDETACDAHQLRICGTRVTRHRTPWGVSVCACAAVHTQSLPIHLSTTTKTSKPGYRAATAMPRCLYVVG
jgi:hypothetical protein